MENGVLSERINGIASDLREIKDQLRTVGEALTKLARLEERHESSQAAISRAFAKIDQHEARLIAMEVQQPITLMVRNWVIAGIVGVCGLLGTQLVAVIWFVTRQMPL